MAKDNKKYNRQLVKEIEEWVSTYGLIDYDGAKVNQLLKHFGICDNTYYSWRKKYPAFAEAIERGKAVYKVSKSAKLEKSLFKAAEGGYVEEETETTEYVPARHRGNNNDNADDTQQAPPTIRRMTRTKTKKYLRPDVGAAIFLLTNLDPEHYQNKQRTDVSIKRDKESGMTIEEINAEIERLEKLEKGK